MKEVEQWSYGGSLGLLGLSWLGCFQVCYHQPGLHRDCDIQHQLLWGLLCTIMVLCKTQTWLQKEEALMSGDVQVGLWQCIEGNSMTAFWETQFSANKYGSSSLEVDGVIMLFHRWFTAGWSPLAAEETMKSQHNLSNGKSFLLQANWGLWLHKQQIFLRIYTCLLLVWWTRTVVQAN